ncbi:hypothetical protein [Nocardioides acrostichi]|uniref:Uncharacterized protein n=1 Tax=Nocardioides acrostichi TaxID=2784339 RepID=A0A930V2C5_9ACTN|nr:hypothetical protein [Nocardioides acrostichi]MBF4162601.1 hypothetical protein [Nocardioides acrostichi]
MPSARPSQQRPRPPRAPVPQAVYWRRRAVVLVAVLALVGGLTGLLRLITGTGGGAEQATQAGARTTPGPTSDTSSGPATATGSASAEQRGADGSKRGGKEETAPPAQPNGECAPSDISVRPVVDGAVEGEPVSLRLVMRTKVSPACTFEVTPRSITVKITSGSDDIWSTLECSQAVPKKDLVLRSAQASTVSIQWGARRSDGECSRYSAWALPGYYHVEAAALGGEPRDRQFRLLSPDQALESGSGRSNAEGSARSTDSASKQDQKQDQKQGQKQDQKQD